MEKKVGVSLYRTEFFEDSRDGCATFNLYREKFGERSLAAVVIYWDATAQFVIRINGELSVEIVEELILEAKDKIRTK